MLKVLGQPASINVRKVLWALEEIGIAYEREDWGGASRSTSEPAFLALNPNALVPVIQDDGVVLRESNTIIRYLAAKHGRFDLLPQEAAARALVELWMDWQASEFNNAWRYAFQALVRKSPSFADNGQIASSIASWTSHMAILQRQLEGTDGYVVGPAFTLADIPIGLSVNRWFMTPLDRPEFSAVAAYYERLSKRPAFLKHGRNGVP
jgi:glutathione S-transferase